MTECGIRSTATEQRAATGSFKHRYGILDYIKVGIIDQCLKKAAL